MRSRIGNYGGEWWKLWYNVTMKKCSKCKQVKALNLFYLRSDGRSSDGKQSCCMVCSKDKKRLWYIKHSTDPHVRRSQAISTAKERNLKFSISLKQYTKLISGVCDYCEVDITKDVGVGLDRLDNKLGYLVNNVVPCCGPCNTGRSDRFTPQEWKVMIYALKEWRKTQVPTLTPDKRSELLSKQS